MIPGLGTPHDPAFCGPGTGVNVPVGEDGETYYRHWLATLEKLVVEKRVTTTDTLHRTRDAWDHAADRTPHGSPIVLRPEDFEG